MEKLHEGSRCSNEFSNIAVSHVLYVHEYTCFMIVWMREWELLTVIQDDSCYAAVRRHLQPGRHWSFGDITTAAP